MSADYDASLEIKAGLDNIANEMPTLRQLYAGMAMQGFLAGARMTFCRDGTTDPSLKFWAKVSAEAADALIAELNRVDAAK